MWSSFGEVLPQAVGIAISPLPIVMVILMLVSARARSNGPAFLIGWFVGAIVLTGAAFLAADVADASTDSAASDGVNALQLVIGLLFWTLATRQFRKRPQPGVEPPMPPLFAALDGFRPGKALGLGAVACVVNPKNLSLGISAGAALAQAGVTGGSAVVAVLLFVVVASVGVGAPVVVLFALGERADGVLASWKTWLITNNATVMTVLFGVLGANAVGSGLGLLS
jgi:hypothetical protein